MACGTCGGKKKPAAAKVTEVRTTGAWKLTVDGKVVNRYDTRVGAQADNLRKYSGKGIVERSA